MTLTTIKYVCKQPLHSHSLVSLPLRAARTVQWTGLHSTSRWRHRHAVITVHRQVEAVLIQRCQSDTFCWMLQSIKHSSKYICILSRSMKHERLLFDMISTKKYKSKFMKIKCHADYKRHRFERHILLTSKKPSTIALPWEK